MVLKGYAKRGYYPLYIELTVSAVADYNVHIFRINGYPNRVGAFAGLFDRRVRRPPGRGRVIRSCMPSGSTGQERSLLEIPRATPRRLACRAGNS